MRLIKSSVEQITPNKYTLKDIKKQIELAGRTCYKSEDKITEDSCEEFVQRMINSGHLAMLEHGTVYLTIPTKEDKEGLAYKYMLNPYSKVIFYDENTYITTNYRVIIENEWEDHLKYLSEPTESHERRLTFKFICDRGVSHEIVRHRGMSFAQESTRYCNYTKDKFNDDITYIIPTWLENKLPEGQYVYWDGDWCDLNEWKIQHADDDSEECTFLYDLQNNEDYYKVLINKGWKPQQARQVLPNALKTEIIVTGYVPNWLHFLELRLAENAHPDIQKLAYNVAEILGGK